MITTERNVFIAAHVTDKLKTAINAEADKDKVSVSKFTFKTLLKELRERGYDLEDVE